MKRNFVFATVLAILAGTAVSCSEKIEDKFNMLRPGMNREKVVFFMGEPTEETIIQKQYIPTGAPGAQSSDLNPEKYLPEIRRLVWVDGDKKVTVELTEDKLTLRSSNFTKVYRELR